MWPWEAELPAAPHQGSRSCASNQRCSSMRWQNQTLLFGSFGGSGVALTHRQSLASIAIAISAMEAQLPMWQPEGWGGHAAGSRGSRPSRYPPLPPSPQRWLIPPGYELIIKESMMFIMQCLLEIAPLQSSRDTEIIKHGGIASFGKTKSYYSSPFFQRQFREPKIKSEEENKSCGLRCVTVCFGK